MPAPPGTIDHSRLVRPQLLPARPLEGGKVAFGAFVPPGSIPDGTWIVSTRLDAAASELEHDPLDR